MDLGPLVIAGAVGCALTGVAVGCVAWIRRLNRRLASMDRLVDQLRTNTVSRESLMTEAQERQSRIVLLRAMFRDNADLLDRESPGAVQQELRDMYPHLFLKSEDRIG